MKRDTTGDVQTRQLQLPPSRGPGSGKDAWVRQALELLDANSGLSRVIDDQSELIRDLKAEIELLRRQVAERKPKGGRAALDDRTVTRIEEALEHKGATCRSIARAFGVSAMSVSRIKSRVRARQALM